MVTIPTGIYTIGVNDDDGFSVDMEGPQVTINLDEFSIDKTTVTNEQFKKFIDQTGYVTEAEEFGWSYVFHYFLSDDNKNHYQQVYGLNWWYAVDGASWKHPYGTDSSIQTILDHPVVHISHNDALAYCKWANKRLPTEAEWEVAAKGGTNATKYYWGDNLTLDGKHMINIWQGEFPISNTLEDGFAGTAPAKHFEPNGYGIYQMLGNVWEWCSNPQSIPLSDFKQNDWAYYYQLEHTDKDAKFALKGGSFLCHFSYCKRYRIAARNGNTAQSTSNNTGFRCVSL